MNEVIVRITSNYGQEAIYPANEAGMTFLRLTGKKTLSRFDINNIKSLGFTISVEQATL